MCSAVASRAFAQLPGPRQLPGVGSLLIYSSLGRYDFDHLHKAKRSMRETYGDIYVEKLGPVNLVQLFSAEDFEKVYRLDGSIPARPTMPLLQTALKRDGIGLGLGALNDQEWYNLRRATQKLFLRPQTAASFLPEHNIIADQFIDLIQENICSRGSLLDISALLFKYTVETVGHISFGRRLNCFTSNSVGSNVVKDVKTLFECVQKTSFSFPWYAFFRTHVYQDFVIAKLKLDDCAKSYIDGSEAALGNNIDIIKSLQSQSKLTEEEIVAVVTDVFIAGVDSTTNALSFVLYNLASNPKEQDALAAELQEVLGQSSIVTSSHIERMRYLKACVRESFRLNFPVEGGPVRILQQDCELGGYSIPRGTCVSMNNQTLCLDPSHFPEPDKYMPERWITTSPRCTRNSQTSPFVMLPFGAGPRGCIGRRFAEMEIYLAVAKIIHKYKLDYHGEPVGMLSRLFTNPDTTIKLHFSER